MSLKRRYPYGDYNKSSIKRRSYTPSLTRNMNPRVRRRKYARAFRPGYDRTEGNLGIETKYLDTTVASTTLSNVGTILSNSLNVIPQGDGQSDREGRRVIIVKISLRGIISTDATEDTDSYRFIIYMDTQTNAAAATVAMILESTVVLSFNNMSNSRRFRILYDSHGVLSPTAGIVGAFASTTKWIKFNKKCNIIIDYNATATTGAIGTITSNNIGVLGISTSGRANVTFTARIRFRG